ncbi:MAG: hypothetical protein BZY81_02305 [SAR202 cluster bacterium Io17-Chloro-G4]|nr:MAG: hypothetical protein BZY81_02305 [SAR202 cluster bacterium Io17-Chloro-G4]
MAVRIVTDSASDLPAELASRWNIEVVPCYVVIGDRSYKDGVDLSADEFYSQLTSSARLPTTSQPTPADFQTVYQDLMNQGHHVVSIHVSGKLSGTLNSAHQARVALGDEALGAIEIVDSQLASVPLALLAISAAEKAEDSNSLQEIAEAVRREVPDISCFFVPDTLEYLQRGGRIGKASAFLGSVLNVKPILTIRDGEAHPLERTRNLTRAMNRIVELAQENAPVRQLAVMYSTQREPAESLQDGLSGLLAAEHIIVARFGPTLGTYLGPGAIGVALAKGDDILKS